MNCVHLLTPGVKRARKSSDSLEEEEVMLMLPDVSTAYTTMEPNFAIIIDTKEIIAIWIVFLDNAWQSLDGNKYLSTYRNTYST